MAQEMELAKKIFETTQGIEPQRGWILKPRVVKLPWVYDRQYLNPEWVASVPHVARQRLRRDRLLILMAKGIPQGFPGNIPTTCPKALPRRLRRSPAAKNDRCGALVPTQFSFRSRRTTLEVFRKLR